MSLSGTPATATGRSSAIRCILLVLAPLICIGRNPLLAAQQKPMRDPPGQYDDAKVPQYTLPDPLLLLNGKKVASTRTWTKKRRPEILKLFETSVYGRTMVGRPKTITWQSNDKRHGPGAGHIRRQDRDHLFRRKER
jgi:hypothetical protein